MDTLTQIQSDYLRRGCEPAGQSGGLHFDSHAAEGPRTIIPEGWPSDKATCAHEAVATYPNGKRVCGWCYTRWSAREKSE